MNRGWVGWLGGGLVAGRAWQGRVGLLQGAILGAVGGGGALGRKPFICVKRFTPGAGQVRAGVVEGVVQGLGRAVLCDLSLAPNLQRRVTHPTAVRSAPCPSRSKRKSPKCSKSPVATRTRARVRKSARRAAPSSCRPAPLPVAAPLTAPRSRCSR